MLQTQWVIAKDFHLLAFYAISLDPIFHPSTIYC